MDTKKLRNLFVLALWLVATGMSHVPRAEISCKTSCCEMNAGACPMEMEGHQCPGMQQGWAMHLLPVALVKMIMDKSVGIKTVTTPNVLTVQPAAFPIQRPSHPLHVSMHTIPLLI